MSVLRVTHIGVPNGFHISSIVHYMGDTTDEVTLWYADVGCSSSIGCKPQSVFLRW